MSRTAIARERLGAWCRTSNDGWLPIPCLFYGRSHSFNWYRIDCIGGVISTRGTRESGNALPLSGARAPTDACRAWPSIKSRQSTATRTASHLSSSSNLGRPPGHAGCLLGCPASQATNKMHIGLQLNDGATSAAGISAFCLDCLRPPLPLLV